MVRMVGALIEFIMHKLQSVFIQRKVSLSWACGDGDTASFHQIAAKIFVN